MRKSSGGFSTSINVCGAFLAGKRAERVMIPKKKGNILFPVSVVSINHSTSSPHPNAAPKYAVLGLTRNPAAELGQYGIRVNCISPFGVPTPLACKGIGVDRETFMEMSSSLSNLKQDETDVARAALYLASDESKHANGLNLVVDGGYTLNPVTRKV